MYRPEFSTEYRQSLVSCTTAAFDLDSDTLPVAFDHEVDFIVLFPPIIDLKVLLVCHIQNMCPDSALYPSSPDFRVVNAFLKEIPDNALNKDVLNTINLGTELYFLALSFAYFCKPQSSCDSVSVVR